MNPAGTTYCGVCNRTILTHAQVVVMPPRQQQNQPGGYMHVPISQPTKRKFSPWEVIGIVTGCLLLFIAMRQTSSSPGGRIDDNLIAWNAAYMSCKEHLGDDIDFPTLSETKIACDNTRRCVVVGEVGLKYGHFKRFECTVQLLTSKKEGYSEWQVLSLRY